MKTIINSMNRTLIFLLIAISSFYTTKAQNFLWGQSGGASESSGNNSAQEQVYDMATDPNGNLYVIANVRTFGLKIAGLAAKAHGYQDIAVVSFSPSGTLRWYKIIGGGAIDYPYGIKTDNAGGVYIAGGADFDPTPGVTANVYIDKDDSIKEKFRDLFLVKYDTGGNYKWLRVPQADTVGISSQCVAGDLSIDASGNTYWLTYLAPGIYGGAGGTVITQRSCYVMKYDASGNFKGLTQIGFALQGPSYTDVGFTHDNLNDRYFITGGGVDASIKVWYNGADTIKGGMYIICYDKTGALLWKKENNVPGGIPSAPVFDRDGNIYVNGVVQSDSFCGHTFKTTVNGVPFIMKLDKNGNAIWGRNEATVVAAAGSVGVALRNDNEVCLLGLYNKSFKWDDLNDAFSSSSNYDIMISRFDTKTGKTLGMDKVTGGGLDQPNCIVGDGKGNVYIGGQFASSMYINPISSLSSAGGECDWFVTKYGDMWPATIPQTGSVKTDKMAVYPNPVNDYFTVSGAEKGSRYSVTNVVGQELLTGTITADEQSINVSRLWVGTYIVTVTGSKGMKASRNIVKQ